MYLFSHLLVLVFSNWILFSHLLVLVFSNWILLCGVKNIQVVVSWWLFPIVDSLICDVCGAEIKDCSVVSFDCITMFEVPFC